LTGASNWNSTNATQCSSLESLSPVNVLYPRDDAYASRQKAYFINQHKEMLPACRYLPSDPYSLRAALQRLVASETSFAVHAGGHSYNTGASNIENGVTIDLSRLNSIDLVDNNAAAWVGPGARWRDVYAALEPHGITLPGGRVADVGVGGYVLGGGFSWFSAKKGWVCDSVLEFEVVTPDGRVLYASADRHEDLFWALKGSLGAFGIVTAIKMPTIEFTGIHGGVIVYEQTQVPKLITALNNLAIAEDERATQAIMNFVWNRGQNKHLYVASFTNTDNDGTAPALTNWTSIPNQVNALHTSTMSQAAEELLGPDLPKQRRTKFVLTTRASEEVISYIHSTFLEATTNTTDGSNTNLGDTVIMTIQPLTRPHLAASSASNNIFPLNADDGALLIVNIELYWDNKDQDAYFEQQSRMWHDRWMEEFARIGALPSTGWIYPNYAGEWQEIWSAERLGKNTTDKLSEIREKYDGQGVWKRLVPGAWHF
jgi:FAD/FMN-containing dehydrogenase